jgi:hypothetical protein
VKAERRVVGGYRHTAHREAGPADPRRVKKRIRGGRSGNTAELSGELSVGDLVAAGDKLLAVAPHGWEPVTGPLTEVRTREHGTSPLSLPARSPGSGPAPDPRKENHGE